MSQFVQWGGVPGAGFARNHGSVPEPAPEFVMAAKRLLHSDDGVQQPPSGIPDIHEYPVLGLRRVEVENHGPQWCVSVQSRGGALGSAGICQFLFEPVDADPARLWDFCAALVREHGALVAGVDSAGSFGGPRSHGVVRPVLEGLLAGRKELVVDGEPDDVTGAVGALLCVLPIEVIVRYVWTTYLLHLPAVTELGVVSGRWPSRWQHTSFAERAERFLSKETDLLHLSEVEDRALGWLTARAHAGTVIGTEHRALPGMTDLLEAIARDELEIALGDVPALVARNDVRLGKPNNVVLVRQWARDDVLAAISALVGKRPLWLKDLLFDGVRDAHRAAPPGANPAHFPPATGKAHTAWNKTLTTMLLRHFPEREHRLAYLLEEVVAPGRPLHDLKARDNAKEWFRALGFSRADRDAEQLFPITADVVAKELGSRGSFGDEGRRFIEKSSDLVADLELVIDHMHRIGVDAAVSLLAAPPEMMQVRTLWRKVLQHNDLVGHRDVETFEEWLVALSRSSLSADVRRMVVETGVRELPEMTADFRVAVVDLAAELLQPDGVDLARALRLVADELSAGDLVDSAPPEPPPLPLVHDTFVTQTLEPPLVQRLAPRHGKRESWRSAVVLGVVTFLFLAAAVLAVQMIL
jgi:hypothetical protein